MTIVDVAPTNTVGALLMPVVAQRMLRFAVQNCPELDPFAWTASVMTRLWYPKPSVVILAFLDAAMQVVGHAVTVVESSGGRRYAFVSQAELDSHVDGKDVIERAIQLTDSWAASHGATLMVMTTDRSPRAWDRKYGFLALRTVMARPIGEGSLIRGERMDKP